MQISQIIGGYTLGGADMLRRAMGKKKPEEMAKHRETIAAGAAAKGYEPALAEELFDLMTKFAEYGFNKSHTAAYAVVTYHTAWLKAHHCAAFMAASLSSDMDNTDTVNIFFLDAKKNRLTVLPPDVNESEYRFVPVSRSEIRYGLGAVKGTGEQAVNCILEARKAGGPFKDLFDFCLRVDRRMVNRRTIEALIRAGAFDTTMEGASPDRNILMSSVALAMEAAEQAAANAHQGGLFDDAPTGVGTRAPEYVGCKPWSEREKLQNEKQALGFYLSGHPFTTYAQEFSRFARRKLAQLESSRDPTVVAGLVVSSRVQMTRRGKMAFVTLDDGTAQIEVSVFNELFDASRNKLREDEVLVVEGRAQFDDYSNSMRVVADSLLTAGEARARFARRLELKLNGEVAGAGGAHAACTRLRTLLEPFRADGGCMVRLHYRNEQAVAPIDFGERWRVRLDDALFDGLRDWLPADSVGVMYG
jgi:DNA polymerase-3 subunit alpha